MKYTFNLVKATDVKKTGNASHCYIIDQIVVDADNFDSAFNIALEFVPAHLFPVSANSFQY